MPRAYNGTASDRWAIGPNSGFNWGGSTCAAIFTKTADGTYHGMCVLLNSGGTAVSSLEIDNSNRMEFYNGTTSVHSQGITALTSTGQVMFGMSKAAGTTTPRAHVLPFLTGGAGHGDFSGTIADPSAPGAGGFWEVAGFETVDFAQFHLDRLAVFPYAMSDMQFDSLARNRHWGMYNPIFHVENPPGGRLKPTTPDLSRFRAPQTTASNLLDSNLRGPPGMRYSPRWRRAL